MSYRAGSAPSNSDASDVAVRDICRPEALCVMLDHNRLRRLFMQPPKVSLSLDRALQFHAAALAIFGAVFIGLGRESALVPALTALACLAAVAVADVLGW